MDGVKVPESWSQVAVDVLVQKYFRKKGVPQRDADGRPELDASGRPVLGPERDARQVFERLAGCWTEWGERYGYFDSDGRSRRLPRRALLHARAPVRVRPTRRSGSTPASICSYGIEVSSQWPLATSTPRPAKPREVDSYELSAAARLLHPVDRRRPGQRRRHHGSLGA